MYSSSQVQTCNFPYFSDWDTRVCPTCSVKGEFIGSQFTDTKVLVDKIRAYITANF